ncbi:hypothetical protein A3C89_01550 [Candidatus Kaiserbacteria bacterium RIFCSPHIGHO2_02_FULL_50_50]|uniref:RNA 2',3'-cyclic 3'-phosphodiesterase n=1 Tax=Candidatus Kaiserbacteria bacterium RIFCSPHIGHO2_02_FULL_50_50 TaxID=1798492 RepID=A0A1F6DCF3_9BACT|nr:MAG: hypothetical protein A3C89_01550 [Candidatus Kaiserbacteria bacterium RIFCSPHIGHO2_02_FULL_50_50]OGG88139.1 MAG: hypothetical protein A3G62_02585 [Candidatus Kaiserbacteria bacterium RIFCSPLOWO2_12_FULL_50_10]
METYFIGFVLPEEVREALAKATSKLPAPWVGTAADDMHLTVHYLGRVPEELLAQLEAITGCIVDDTAPMRLEHGRTIVMRPAKPYMLWAKYVQSPWFDTLVGDCARRLAKLTEHKDGHHASRAAIPHLTLARLPHGTYAESLVPPLDLPQELTSIRLDTLALWRAEAGKYTVVRSWNL